ncbi:MAG: glycosyltransferase [Gemmatimonadota bacterium]
MRASVAICTRNRCAALAQTLRALTEVVAQSSLALDLIVVDNGSTDDTPRTIASFNASLPLRTIVEQRIGLSHARNAVIDLARGDYIVWIDDDVIVDPDWLRAYGDAFRAWPDAAFFGGPIVPDFAGTPPRWLHEALPQIGNAYAMLDLGPAPRSLDAHALPFGANFAIRADAQRRHRYDPKLGRRGDLLYAGEEWGVLASLLEEGSTGRWVPGARVRHLITAERQTTRYLRRYYIGNGMSHASVRTADGESMLFDRPRWVWREALAQEIAYRATRIFAPPRHWSAHLKRASVAWGMLRVPAGQDRPQRSDSRGPRG